MSLGMGRLGLAVVSGRSALVGEPKELVGEALARRTFWLDSARSSMAGVAEAFARTFFLLIALKAFNAPKIDKSLIACAGGVGMLASPVLVSVVMRGRWKVSHAASIIVAVGGALLIFPLLFHNLYVYVACAMGAIAVGDGIAVLMAPIHAANYPAGRRGKYVSGSLMVRVLSAAIAGYAIGGILKGDMGRWPLVVGFALATWLAQAVLLWRIPSPVLALAPTDHSAARRRWNLVRDDAILRNVLISWMFMGVGNLMTIPLRVEYLSKSSYGISANAAKIALLTVTVPAVVRLFLTPGFGWIFDRVDFFTVRILVNLAFAVSIASFFAGTSDASLYFGAVTFGIGIAGGDVLWSLWTTKFAPPDKVADYMSIHTFTTGIRGTAAPFLAFWLVGSYSPRLVGFLCAGLTFVGSAFILPEALRHRRTKRLSDGLGEVPLAAAD
jgi:predicted MFS family arabinose efflux permease